MKPWYRKKKVWASILGALAVVATIFLSPERVGGMERVAAAILEAAIAIGFVLAESSIDKAATSSPPPEALEMLRGFLGKIDGREEKKVAMLEDLHCGTLPPVSGHVAPPPTGTVEDLFHYREVPGDTHCADCYKNRMHAGKCEVDPNNIAMKECFEAPPKHKGG